jgi:penicillin-binding protein 2
MRKFMEKGWRSTYMMFIGIGQGEIQMSTLQIANLAAIIANRGFMCAHLIKGFKNKKVLIPPTFREKHYSGVDAKFYTPVIAGMDAAVAASGVAGARPFRYHIVW